MSKPVATSYPWTCAIGLHPWAKYGAVREVVIVKQVTVIGGVSFTDTSPAEWTEFYQERECLGCGLVRRRQVKETPG